MYYHETWGPHTLQYPGLVEAFLNTPGVDLRLLSLWGHSYEMREIQPVWVKDAKKPWNDFSMGSFIKNI